MTYIITLLIVGLFAGTLSGLLGVGGGVILIPALLFFAKLTIHEAIGVSLAIIVPTALVGAIKHYHSADLNLLVISVVAIGAVVGSYLGAYYAHSIPGLTLKRFFGLFLIIMGIYFVASKKVNPEIHEYALEDVKIADELNQVSSSK